MRANRGLIFWGVALVTAGAVALAIQSGALDGADARQTWRLWPVVLIVVGLAVIAGRTSLGIPMTLVAGIVVGGLGGTLVAGWPDGLSLGCGGDVAEAISADGDFSDGAEVELDLNCGELRVDTAGGNAWTLNAGHAPDAAPTIQSGDGNLHVESRGGGFMALDGGRQAWDLTLPTDVAVVLAVEANAASSQLALSDATLTELSLSANAGEVIADLGGAAVSVLNLDANAGSVSITVDAATEAAGSIELNAGSLEICAPPDAAIAISVPDDTVTFSHNLDSTNLERSGDTWQSGAGDPTVSLEIEGNAASFTLNPDGGCS
jgi:hypothetical protein